MDCVPHLHQTPAEVGVRSELDLPVWIGVLSSFTVDLKMVNASKSMVREQLRFGAWHIKTIRKLQGNRIGRGDEEILVGDATCE